jgi:hypothetical protein
MKIKNENAGKNTAPVTPTAPRPREMKTKETKESQTDPNLRAPLLEDTYVPLCPTHKCPSLGQSTTNTRTPAHPHTPPRRPKHQQEGQLLPTKKTCPLYV